MGNAAISMLSRHAAVLSCLHKSIDSTEFGRVDAKEVPRREGARFLQL
jgi:hypothetical protein